MLNLLRYLSNELQISLVCLGVTEARQALGGDVQLARRLDELLLPRWQGDEEFQELVVAIVRNLPLKERSQISARALRQLLQLTDGLTASIFSMFNALALEAVASGAECISDESIAAWQPTSRVAVAFA
jgi:hypothetical protein